MLGFSPQDASSLDQESPQDLATSPTSAVLLSSSASLQGVSDGAGPEKRPHSELSPDADDATQPENSAIAAFGDVQVTAPSKTTFDGILSTPLSDTRFEVNHATLTFGQVSTHSLNSSFHVNTTKYFFAG
jgi:hypothetical protein